MKVIGQYVISWAPPLLREGDRPIRLSPRQFNVLALLVKARGKVVSKQVFFSKVWQGRFVEDGNLSQTIFLIRKVLGRLPDGEEFIETIPGRGYRLAPAALCQSRKESSFGGDTPLARRVQAERFRLLVESIDDCALYMLDSTGRVLTWNLGAEHNNGYKAGEVLGQHFSMFFVPEDIESRVPDRELSMAAIKGCYRGEGWRIRKNGERFWASFYLTALRSAGGKLLGYAKVVRDLTERKRQQDILLRMEALVRRERDRFRTVAESSMDGLYICEAVRDENGGIEDFVYTYLNDNVQNMVRIPSERMLGGKMCELLPINRTLGLFDAYKKVVLTGEPYVAEIPVHDENVVSEWVRLRVVRLEDGIAVTASDITDLKSSEARVAQLLSQQSQHR